MAKQFNKTTFVGNLGKDPEMRYTPSGRAVTELTVASHDQYPNAEGEIVKITTWFKATAWGKRAETINQYFRSGDPIMIEGKLKPDPQTGRPAIWTRQDGSPATDYEVTVMEFYFLPKGDKNEPA
ncbi:MAG: single-stranded DNA-binding protein [Anaerolineae bacterium]|jgi:single-strand DNA-binding protein|nr:single-stranded DNA-binding protein [Anaerolineae bacterium]